jgi:hypothetical protein
VILMEIDTLVMGAYMILFSVDDLLKIIQWVDVVEEWIWYGWNNIMQTCGDMLGWCGKI